MAYENLISTKVPATMLAVSATVNDAASVGTAEADFQAVLSATREDSRFREDISPVFDAAVPVETMTPDQTVPLSAVQDFFSYAKTLGYNPPGEILEGAGDEWPTASVASTVPIQAEDVFLTATEKTTEALPRPVSRETEAPEDPEVPALPSADAQGLVAQMMATTMTGGVNPVAEKPDAGSGIASRSATAFTPAPGSTEDSPGVPEETAGQPRSMPTEASLPTQPMPGLTQQPDKQGKTAIGAVADFAQVISTAPGQLPVSDETASRFPEPVSGRAVDTATVEVLTDTTDRSAQTPAILLPTGMPPLPEKQMPGPPVQDLLLQNRVGDSGWPDELGGQINLMLDKSLQNAEIRLNPEHLGPLRVNIRMENDQLTVQFTAEHVAVREALEAASPRLRDMLASQQLQLTDVSVTPPEPQTRQDRQDGSQAFAGFERQSRSAPQYPASETLDSKGAAEHPDDQDPTATRRVQTVPSRSISFYA